MSKKGGREREKKTDKQEEQLKVPAVRAPIQLKEHVS